MNTINFTAELLNAKIAENGRALIATAEEYFKSVRRDIEEIHAMEVAE